MLYTYGNDSVHSGVHLEQQVAYLDYGSDTESLDIWFDEVVKLFDSFAITGYSLKDNWPDDEDFLMEWLEGIAYLNGVRTDCLGSIMLKLFDDNILWINI